MATRRAKRKPPALPADPPRPTVRRVEFLEAWAEGTAILSALYHRLYAVSDVFIRDPNHPDTFWICANHLRRVVGSLERAMMDMQEGPILDTVRFPELLTEAEGGAG